MKNIYKLLSLVFVLTVLVSCNRDKIDTNLNNIDNLVYFQTASGALAVENGGENIYNVIISTSALTKASASYSISVDPSSTAEEGVDFDILTQSYSIENGTIVSNLEIQGYFDPATIEGKQVTFNLDISQDGFLLVEDRSSFTLEITKLCPLNAPFTGMYTISHVSGGVAAAGFAPVFGDGVLVEVVEGSDITERLFSVKFYPSFGFANAPVDVSFNLTCNQVIVNGNLAPSGVGCGGSIAIGPSDNPSMYDENDDTVISLTFIEDIDNNCGDSAETVVTLTKVM